ncbi:hypothetical protein [Ferrovum myxofaciens]|uniref:hypothetical protein n=1 Tax=Ferrovum myxofaciens TaxID=416213 RepID=UPI00235227AC|nr:hypothetical protein [Ferrovum myxofaciens]
MLLSLAIKHPTWNRLTVVIFDDNLYARLAASLRGEGPPAKLAIVQAWLGSALSAQEAFDPRSQLTQQAAKLATLQIRQTEANGLSVPIDG